MWTYCNYESKNTNIKKEGIGKQEKIREVAMRDAGNRLVLAYVTNQY